MKSKPILSIKNVSKIYHLGDQEIKAVDNVSFDIEEKEFVAIVGKSGSGKSTLMHLIGLLDTPTEGKIYIKNNEVSQLNQAELAKLRNEYIGFVFQQFNLLARTSSIENVGLPLIYKGVKKDERDNRAKEILTDLDMAERLYNHPNELSGGQRQRVAIARALVNEPAVLLADEPTGNLDSKTGDAVLEIFQNLNDKGKTIILVTHDEEIADFAKRKITIQDGKIISDTKK